MKFVYVQAWLLSTTESQYARAPRMSSPTATILQLLSKAQNWGTQVQDIALEFLKWWCKMHCCLPIIAPVGSALPGRAIYEELVLAGLDLIVFPEYSTQV